MARQRALLKQNMFRMGWPGESIQDGGGRPNSLRKKAAAPGCGKGRGEAWLQSRQRHRRGDPQEAWEGKGGFSFTADELEVPPAPRPLPQPLMAEQTPPPSAPGGKDAKHAHGPSPPARTG